MALIVSAATSASAAEHKSAKHKRAAHASADGSLKSEVRELREQLQAMKARLDAQSQTQTVTQAQVATAQAQAAAAQTQAEAVQTQVAANQVKIDTLPDQVKTVVAANKPKTDKIYYKGIGITLGGFLEAASISRDRYLGNDIASSFNSIPFNNSRVGQSSETRFSARQSRLSLLAEGKPDADTTLSFYGEFDFQGQGTASNPNESNSYVPRIRHLYGTVDWNNFQGQGFGLHLLAGQNWSLVTLNTKGITPRNELTPPQIDAQYVPGFAWTRQAQFRVTGDFLDHKLWVAASVENPQTTVGGTSPAVGGGVIVTGGQTSIVQVTGAGALTGANVSLNSIPDVVVKAAYEAKLLDRNVHFEAFGLGRAFTARQTISPASTAATRDDTVYGGGGGGSVVAQIVPGKLDAQISGLWGNGVGRYGSAQLPDVTFNSTGRIKPITEEMYLGGVTMHANKALDLYLFGGEEHVDRQAYPVGSSVYGYGNPLVSNAGCAIEGGSCSATTKLIDQATIGFWQKLYQGPWGRLQVGAQYSYTERKGFTDSVGNGPSQSENMFFTSFRYYPF